MKHVTQRANDDGVPRYYFRRRGVPVLRIFGNPDTPEFIAQYDAALKFTPRRGSWPARERLAAQSQLRRLSLEGRRALCASKLARSVNNRARHQYKVESEITTEWVLAQIAKQDGKCAVSGIPFCYQRGLDTKDRRNPKAPSVDRKDCSKGYTKRNCRLVILAVNVALNLWGDNLFLEICKATVERDEARFAPIV